MSKKLTIYSEEIQVVKIGGTETVPKKKGIFSRNKQEDIKTENQQVEYAEQKVKVAKELLIEDKPFADGGEGLIYRVEKSEYKNVVAKIYKDSTKANKMQRKIEYLIKNSPLLKETPNEIKQSLVWPVDTVYENNQFVGYLMPMVENAIDLTNFVLPDLSINIRNDTKWKRFDRNIDNAYLTRLQIGYQILKSLKFLHDTTKYVLVDLKPDNIKINQQGFISVLDLDSIQISENNKVIFYSSAFTDQFAPAEKYLKEIEITNTQILPTWDYFSYSIILYQLLFGLNPFNGTVLESWGSYDEIVDLIKNGYFPNGKHASKFKEFPEHHPHKNFFRISKSLQELFLKSFDDGCLIPEKRPSFNDWLFAISQEINSDFAKNVKISIQKAKTQKKETETFIYLKNWWSNLNQTWLRILRQELNIVNIPDDKQFNDLLKIKKLVYPSANISDIEPLSILTNLQELLLSDTNIESLEPLETLSLLRSLNIGHTKVKDLKSLSNLYYLNTLKFYNTNVNSLEPLKNLINLEWLYLDNTKIDNLDPIKDLKNLKIISCASTNIKNLDILVNFTSLEKLYCADNQIRTIRHLDNNKSLNFLDITDTQVPFEEIKEFQKMHPLCEVKFSDNRNWFQKIGFKK